MIHSDLSLPNLVDLLKSEGLAYTLTPLGIIIEHPDATITRLEPNDYRVWMDGYLQGRSAVAAATDRTVRS